MDSTLGNETTEYKQVKIKETNFQHIFMCVRVYLAAQLLYAANISKEWI